MKPLVLAPLAVAALAASACSASTGSGAAAAATRTVVVTVSPDQSSGATAPNPSPSPAATISSLPTTSGAPACSSRYLHGSIGLSQGTAGAVDVAIVFKNLNNVACTLYGYPGVAQAAGTPVTDVGQPSTENPTTSRILVTLEPGGYANATLQVTQAANYTASKCDPVAATWLAVIPPNQTVPLYIKYSSTACRSMKVKLLTVTTVQPGDSG
jgi:Protein of unknown function (DUF4232)